MPTDVHKFERECLEAHNQFRAQHGCPPLQLNRTLSTKSREWAQVLAQRKTMEHSSGHNFGENLYMAEGIHVDGARPVKAWYDENEDYDFEAAKFVQGAGHFTQLIWKATQDLGVGVATNDKVTLVVTTYFPPGNVHGKFKENVPRRIDEQNNEPTFIEESTSITSALMGGTINIVLPKMLTSSTRNSKTHELSIPIEMVSTATSPRMSSISDIQLPKPTAQIVLQISSDRLAQPKYAVPETSYSATRESIELPANKIERNSIAIKDMNLMPSPTIETARRERRTSSSGRVMLYRNISNIALGSQEPSTLKQEPRSFKERNMVHRTESNRQEDSRMMPPPKTPGARTIKREPRSLKEQSMVSKTTSTDEMDRQNQTDLLYTTFSNINFGNQEQNSPQPYTATLRTGITRQDPISSKERDMVPAPITIKQEPRSFNDRDIVHKSTSIESNGQEPANDNNRSIMYRTFSKIVLENPDQTIPQTYKVPIGHSLSRQDSLYPQERDMAHVTAPRTEVSRQEQNRETAGLKTFEVKTTRQEPGPSKLRDIVQRSTPAAESERLEEMSAEERKFLYRSTSNIIAGSQAPNTRLPLRRQDSISTKQHEMAHAPRTETARQEQNRERTAIRTFEVQTARQESGLFNKERDMNQRNTPAAETKRQEVTSANDRKFLYRTTSHIVTGSQAPNTRLPMRRQDSVSPKTQEMAHAPRTETARQEQNRETTEKTTFEVKTTRQAPAPSKDSGISQITTPGMEFERQDRISANEKQFLHRKTSNVAAGSQEPNTRLPMRRQDSVSPKAQEMAHAPRTETARQEQNRETTALRTSEVKTTRQEPGPPKDRAQRSTPGAEFERQERINQSNERQLLYRKTSNVAAGSQEPRTRQPIQRQDSIPPKEQDRAHLTASRTEAVRQEQNREAAAKTLFRSQSLRQDPSPSKNSDMAYKTSPIRETQRQQHFSVSDRKLLVNQDSTNQQAKTEISRTDLDRQQLKSTKAEEAPHIAALRAEITRQMLNQGIPPKTTLSIETAQGLKDPKSSKNPDVAHAMSLRKQIANQEHDREMLVKQTPRAVTDRTERQEPESSKKRYMGRTTNQTMETVRQDSKERGNVKQEPKAYTHKDVSHTKISKSETVSRGVSNRDVSQTKIPKPDGTVKQDLKTFTHKDVSQTKIPKTETVRRNSNRDVSKTKLQRLGHVKQEPEPYVNRDVFKIDARESKILESKGQSYITPIVEAQSQEEEPTTSARTTESKQQEPATQTAPSAERLRKIYEFSHADKVFQHECLCAHNCYRVKHGSPPLQLCEQLNLYATKWAQELANLDQLLYSPTEDLGENIYMAAGIRINGATPVKAWYNEIEDYDFKKAEFTAYTGHFTQVIWKDTRELGVGVIKNEKCCIVVASYFPPGNETGQYKENVLPLLACLCDIQQRNNNNNNNNNNSSSTSPRPRSRSRLFHAGLIVAAVAAAVGGWIILTKPSIL